MASNCMVSGHTEAGRNPSKKPPDSAWNKSTYGYASNNVSRAKQKFEVQFLVKLISEGLEKKL